MSHEVKVTWAGGTNQTPVVNAGPDQAITLPASAQLTGTVTDDGLPVGAALTITWSKVSGPGDVAFLNASQPATSASFSAAGTYVLKIQATDSLLVGEDTVTVTVNGSPAVTQGWFESPLDGARVSGLTPIRVIPSVTLTSGTLSYWAASASEASATVLNANTTGTGQIGTLDSTVLANGSYWIKLAATNTVPVTQTNLLLVTVSGEDKPGRMMSTITDFTAPLAGLPIQIQRSYDSLERGISGDFGYGWKLGVDALRTEVGPSNEVTLTVAGQRKTFLFTPQPSIIGGWYTPKYTAEAGLYGKLENTGDNCTGVLLRVGNTWRCGIVDGIYTPTGWKYVDPAGREFVIGAERKLKSTRDLNGNTLTIASDGVTSSAGNVRIAFTRDAEGRISKITDPLGKEYLYGYNGAGELSTVTYPSIATAAQYFYDAGHLLREYKDPRGITAATTVYDASGRLQSVTDIDGTTSYAYNVSARTTTVTYPDTGVEVIETDAQGNVVRRVDGLNRTTTYTFDGNNNLLMETNPLAKVWTYTYDANGFRTSVKNPLNQTDSVTYNAYGGPTAVTNALSQTQSVTYDASFRVKTITDSLGQIADFSYNPQGLPLTMKDARANTSSYGYDTYGNRTSYADPEGRTTNATFNAFGQKLTETDARGNKTTFTYDDLGRLRTVTDPDNRTTTYEYDANGNKTAEVDALSRRTTFEYDAKNRLTKTTHPDLTFTQKTYDFRGNVLTETDESGRVTKSVYDKAGQVTSVTRAFGTADAGTASFTYDLAGRKLTEVDERNNTTTYGYDDAGRLLTVTNAQSKVTTYAYDAAGRRRTVTDAQNHTTTSDYDARGRMTKETYPDTKFVTHTYDGLGLRLTTTDQENRTTTWGYDKASQLVSVTNALSQVTTYGYDLNGNKTRQTDALNHSTTYEYDKLNRRTKRTLPMGQVETFTYDAIGNMLTRRDFNGKTTTYGYDSRNRLLSKTPDPTLSGQTPVVFTYNGTGTRATMADAGGSSSYTHDNRNRLLTKATPQGTLTYTYLANGLVGSVVSSNANGVSIAYGYDSLNRLATVTDNRITPGVTTYAYNDVDNVATVTRPNGVVHTYGYDVNDALATLPITKPPATLKNYVYLRNGVRRILTITEQSGRTANIGYDQVSRLWSEVVTGDPLVNGTLTYVLDAVGNQLSRTSTFQAIPSTNNSFDANDQLPTETYDQNGNTLTAGINSFTYDFVNQIASANAGALSFIYDGDGNRVSKTAGGATTRFLVDDLNPTGYAQVMEELVGGAVQRRYTVGRDRVSQSQLVGGTWTTHFYGYDGQGNVRALTDSLGTVTDTYDYDSWGNLVNSTGSTPNAYRYQAEWLDPEVRFYYMRARYYNPLTGRFLSRDSYEGTEERTASLHQYVYAEGDPVNLRDPSGRAVKTEAALFYGAVTLAVAAFVPKAYFQAFPDQRDYLVNNIGWAMDCIFKLNGGDMARELIRAGISVTAQTYWTSGACTRPIERRRHAEPYPVQWNPGRTRAGACMACPPPPKPRCDRVPPSPPHHPCKHDHVHFFTWTQDPTTCFCFFTEITAPLCLDPPQSCNNTPWGFISW